MWEVPQTADVRSVSFTGGRECRKVELFSILITKHEPAVSMRQGTAGISAKTGQKSENREQTKIERIESVG